LESARACKRSCIEGAARDDGARELEHELLGGEVVTAHERISVCLPVRERRRRERMQPGDNRSAKRVLRALGDRPGVLAGKDTALREAQLARDAEHRRL